MKELDFLAGKREKRKIYFLQGDDELDMNAKGDFQPSGLNGNLSKLGAGKFVEKLTKDNYEVKGLSFRPASPDEKDANLVRVGEGDAKKAEVPDDCNTLFILAPSVRLSATALDAIERYMDKKGQLFVCLGLPAESDYSKLKETGLEDLLRKYGVNVGSEFVLHYPTRQDPQVLRNPFLNLGEIPEGGDSVLAKQFAGAAFIAAVPRIVRPGTSTKFKAEPLVVCDPRSTAVWAEDSLRAFTGDIGRVVDDRRDGRPIETILAKRPLPIAVAVTQDGKPRMVVVGVADFLGNNSFRSDYFRANYDLAVGALAWMGERGFIGPRPVETSNFVFPVDVDFGSMVFGSIWTLIILLVAVGGCVWITRRR